MENKVTKHTKNRASFNVVDAIVTVVALVLIALFFFVLDPFNWFENKAHFRETYITYAIEIKALDEEIIEGINKGDKVIDGNSGEYLGEVDQITSYKAYEWQHVEGKTQMVQIELVGKKDIYITLKVRCVYQQDVGYIVNGQRIAVGSPIDLKTQQLIGSGFCVSITEEELEVK